MPYLLTSGSIYDLSQYGTVGDALQGLAGPFINIAAALLVYIAFLEQKRANDDQRDSLLGTQEELKEQKFQDNIKFLYDRFNDFMTHSNDIITALPSEPTKEIPRLGSEILRGINKCDFILAYLCEFVRVFIKSGAKKATMEEVRLLTSIIAMYFVAVKELGERLDKVEEFAGEQWKVPCMDARMHCHFFVDEAQNLYKFSQEVQKKEAGFEMV